MRLRSRAIKVTRKNSPIVQNEHLLSSSGSSSCESDEDAPTSEIACNNLLEDQVFRRRHKKKMTEQRKLLDHLLESTQIHLDPVMITVIDGIMRGQTVNAIAKSLGLQRNTVDRKIQRLARFYDPKIHGDILDYFPDGVRVKREFITA